MNKNVATVRIFGRWMFPNVSLTVAPKPRVQGPSPCAPAKEKWLETVVLSHFSFFSTSAHGSGKPALTRKIGRQFRIWPYPFVLFPFGTSSKKHQSAGEVLSDFPFSLFPASQILTVRAGRSDGRFRRFFVRSQRRQ